MVSLMPYDYASTVQTKKIVLITIIFQDKYAMFATMASRLAKSRKWYFSIKKKNYRDDVTL